MLVKLRRVAGWVGGVITRGSRERCAGDALCLSGWLGGGYTLWKPIKLYTCPGYFPACILDANKKLKSRILVFSLGPCLPQRLSNAGWPVPTLGKVTS